MVEYLSFIVVLIFMLTTRTVYSQHASIYRIAGNFRWCKLLRFRQYSSPPEEIFVVLIFEPFLR